MEIFRKYRPGQIIFYNWASGESLSNASLISYVQFICVPAWSLSLKVAILALHNKVSTARGYQYIPLLDKPSEFHYTCTHTQYTVVGAPYHVQRII